MQPQMEPKFDLQRWPRLIAPLCPQAWLKYLAQLLRVPLAEVKHDRDHGLSTAKELRISQHRELNPLKKCQKENYVQ